MKKWEMPEVYNLGVKSTQFLNSTNPIDNDSISCSASFSDSSSHDNHEKLLFPWN